jgi:hypothetical protein
MDAAEYLAYFRTQWQELWEHIAAPDGYHATVTTTWEISLNKARETEGAADLLNLCCFLAPDDIPLDLLADHAESLPEALAAVVVNKLKLNRAVGALARYSLLERDGDMLSVHRLVQAVARERMGKEQAKDWVEAAVDCQSGSRGGAIRLRRRGRDEPCRAWLHA